jgi:putative sugar O-methyltransferase
VARSVAEIVAESLAAALIEAEIWRSKYLSAKIAREKTSASEHQEGFLAVCRLAARCDSVFRVFKRNRHYRAVLEHVSEEQGREYLKVIEEEDEELPKYVSKFQENDLQGSPITFDYDIGRFSPTTLRYVKVLADLRNIFGDLSGLDICEIGAGYGGQCKIVSDVFSVASYTIIDLETVIPLIRKYLERLGVRNVVYLTQDKITEGIEFDLVVSNYAFSECIRRVQDHYLDKILKKAQRGYLTCNYDGATNETSPYNKEEIVERISENHIVRILDEKPRTAPMNFILVWDDGNLAVPN